MRSRLRMLGLSIPLVLLAAAPAGAQSANNVPRYDAEGALVSSSLSDLGGTLLYSSAGPAQLQIVGEQNSSRIGQDLVGPFIASDTPGRSIRLATTNASGQLKVAAQLLGTGIFSVTPDPANNGEIAIGPDSLDRLHDYDGQAGSQVHFRLSRAACDPWASPLAPGCDQSNPWAHDFTIAAYDYGIDMSYPGLVEMNLSALSIHSNDAACFPEFGCNRAGQVWIGDELDGGGLWMTSHWDGPGTRGYSVIASDHWAHDSHGPLYFQVRDAADSFSFQSGPFGAEQEVASIDAGGTGHFSAGVQTPGTAVATLMTTNAVDHHGTAVTYEVGDVLVIDPTTDRQVALSGEPYSQLVAGVYAASPALLTGAASPGGAGANGGAAVGTPSGTSVPMATHGIASCKVSAENGAVHRGDLLVTAHHRGYAMRGTAHDRMLGAVVGKALQEVPVGSAVIDILVTLQ